MQEDFKHRIKSPLFGPESLLLKRVLDILVGLFCLLIFAPIILLILIWIRFDSEGNPIFSQVRIGKNGKSFTLYKMRTLYVHHFGIVPGEEEPSDYRITKAGKFLRRSKLDELPQLVNVLLGDMSLVGPRPDIPEQVANYTQEQKSRLLIKPGITGITQISGNTLLTWADRIRLDTWYIQNWSLTRDIKIICYTIIPILQGESLNSDPFGLHSILKDKRSSSLLSVFSICFFLN